MQRRPDWPARLAEHVAEGTRAQFRWGEVDCCLWACSGVETMTGVDPAAPLRKRYRDKEGAIEALRLFAGGGLLQAAEKLAREHGKARLAGPLYAQRGDLVMARGPEGWPDGLGLCVGSAAVFLTPRGLRRAALEHTLTAWRI